MIAHPKELISSLDELGYVVDEQLATVIYLTLTMGKPLLLEGHPGVGKTELAQILAGYLNTKLIRLQCYEGLDASQAIYEWNYQKQLLSIKIQEQSDLTLSEKEALIFSEEFLLQRPLLQAITAPDPVVLLIDEIDRADEEFEAFLLELLSAFQVSIPELGTIEAVSKPIVVLTSNRTRELSDALRRRCLYHWVNYPSVEKEKEIVRKHLPAIDTQLLENIVHYVHRMRELRMDKVPGVAETIDWAAGVVALQTDDVLSALSCVVKSDRDMDLVKNELFTGS